MGIRYLRFIFRRRHVRSADYIWRRHSAQVRPAYHATTFHSPPQRCQAGPSYIQLRALTVTAAIDYRYAPGPGGVAGCASAPNTALATFAEAAVWTAG